MQLDVVQVEVVQDSQAELVALAVVRLEKAKPEVQVKNFIVPRS